MESRKMFGLILFIVGLVFILINVFVVYPYISCFFAPLTFWLFAIVGFAGGILLIFNINLSYSEES